MPPSFGFRAAPPPIRAGAFWYNDGRNRCFDAFYAAVFWVRRDLRIRLPRPSGSQYDLGVDWFTAGDYGSDACEPV